MRTMQSKRKPKGNRKWRVSWAKVHRHATQTHKFFLTLRKILAVSIAIAAQLAVLIHMIGC
jgi:hypothetical protein